jgi:hypothetical protein
MEALSQLIGTCADEPLFADWTITISGINTTIKFKYF